MLISIPRPSKKQKAAEGHTIIMQLWYRNLQAAKMQIGTYMTLSF